MFYSVDALLSLLGTACLGFDIFNPTLTDAVSRATLASLPSRKTRGRVFAIQGPALGMYSALICSSNLRLAQVHPYR